MSVFAPPRRPIMPAFHGQRERPLGLGGDGFRSDGGASLDVDVSHIFVGRTFGDHYFEAN
jgi:hypothetical protein